MCRYMHCPVGLSDQRGPVQGSTAGVADGPVMLRGKALRAEASPLGSAFADHGIGRWSECRLAAMPGDC